MPLNQPKFHIRQLKGFVEHGIGHTDFTHIMQHRHIINILNVLLRPAQTLCQEFRVRCHPHGVSFGIVILRIHRISDRHDCLNRDALHLLRLFIQSALQILPITVQLQRASDPAEHDIRLKGLGNIIVCAHTETLDLCLRAAVSRQKDNRNLLPARILLQLFHHLKTAYFRHIDIQKNQIRRMPLQILKRLLSRIYGYRLILPLEQFLRG